MSWRVIDCFQRVEGSDTSVDFSLFDYSELLCALFAFRWETDSASDCYAIVVQFHRDVDGSHCACSNKLLLCDYNDEDF
jgi:hypothetical protein